MKSYFHLFIRPVNCVVLTLLLTACAGDPAITQSKKLQSEGKIEESVAVLEHAMKEAPDDLELRAQYYRQRDVLVGQLLLQADTERLAYHHDEAQALYTRVQKMDVNSPRAREGLLELAAQQHRTQSVQEAKGLMDAGNNAAAERLLRSVVAENPSFIEARKLLTQLREQTSQITDQPQPALKTAFNTPLTLEFRDTPLKTVFEMISRSAALNFVFDKDVRTDARVTLFVRNTNIEDVIKLVLTTNQLDRKQLNENTLLIYPNTPLKIKDYVELVTRSFYLSNTEAKQAQTLIRTVVKTKDIFIDEKLNLLIIKDTPNAVKLAERLIESLDVAEPEVMLDVEVLEISRTKMQELGVRFPDQIGYGLLTPSLNSTIVNGNVSQSSTTLGGALAPGNIDLNNTSGLTAYVANPGLMLNLKNQITDSNILANPRIRVKNREKAKIHIGDKLPVFTTTSTANVGVAASVAYLDVGLKLEVEPNVYLDDDVGIKVGLEVSSVVKEVSGPGGSTAYQIGNRAANTVLRLKNGETQVLAGLINDEERSSANRLPGLGDIPVLGRLFSNQMDNKNKTEIVLLITPRIVRNLLQPQGVMANIAAGTDATVGAPTLTIKTNVAQSVGIAPESGRSGVPRPIRDTANNPVDSAAIREDATVTEPPVAPDSMTPNTDNVGAPKPADGAPVALPSTVTLTPMRP